MRHFSSGKRLAWMAIVEIGYGYTSAAGECGHKGNTDAGVFELRRLPELLEVQDIMIQCDLQVSTGPM